MPFSNFFSRTSGSVGGGKGVPGSQATSKDVIALGGDLVILRKCVKNVYIFKKDKISGTTEFAWVWGQITKGDCERRNSRPLFVETFMSRQSSAEAPGVLFLLCGGCWRVGPAPSPFSVWPFPSPRCWLTGRKAPLFAPLVCFLNLIFQIGNAFTLFNHQTIQNACNTKLLVFYLTVSCLFFQ